MAARNISGDNNGFDFEDFFPSMVAELGAEGFMEELCNGFQMLMGEEKGVITIESLKRKTAFLGLRDMSDEEIRGMVREGDVDGDGCLNQMEFCVLMFRLSPALMEGSRVWLQFALHVANKNYVPN